MKNLRLSILIAAYNEERSIGNVMREIKEVDLSQCGISEKEVILIDDGSTDKTPEIAVSVIPNTKVIHHIKNRGKGASLASGIVHATGDIILIQDADSEYKPSLYPLLLAPIVWGEADIVYGSRFLDKKRPEDMKIAYFLANRSGTILMNFLNGAKLTDAMTCFKVFKKHALKGLTITCKGFGADAAEVTAKLIKKGFKIKEVPIPYKARTFKEGKKFQPIHSLHVLWAIIKYSLAS